MILSFKTTYGLDIEPVDWSFNVTKGLVDVAETFKYKGNLGALGANSTASGIDLVERRK